MEEKKDLTIKCRNCGKEFTYTIGEQKFYEDKGFAAPVRCKECRAARKANQEEPQQKNATQKEEKTDIEKLLEKFRNETISFEEADKMRKSRR